MYNEAIRRWTAELAYAVGLITTDGNLSSDRRHINLTSSDPQLLRTFRKCLDLENRITKNPPGSFSKKQSYRIQFGSVSLYGWLIKIGLMPRKTTRLKEIHVPDKYMRDFLRGHLDGDGSIVTYIDRYMVYKNKRYTYKRVYLTFYSSSLKHLEWIQSKIKHLLKLNGNLSGWKSKNRKIKLWKLRFAKTGSIKMLSWIYYKPDLPCLNRKRKIAQRFLTKTPLGINPSIPAK